MSKKSWHLSRRTFLQGSGVAMALPFLDSMADAADGTSRRRRSGARSHMGEIRIVVDPVY